MKYVLTCILLTALLFAQDAPTNSSSQSTAADQNTADQNTPAVPTDQESVRKAKAVLDQAIAALGGDAYLNWKTQTSEGRSYSFHHGEPNSVGTLFWRFKQFPDKDRLELTKKRDVTEIFNGDKGYEVTYKGVRNLDEKDELAPYLRRRHYSLDLVLRQWLHEPGVALFYDGQTVAAQKETDEVMIMNAKNEAVTLNFDINTHLPVKKSFVWRDPVDKQRNVEEEIFDNYRLINGIQTPFDVTRIFNGDMAFQSFLTSASYNQPLDASMFDPKAQSGKKR
jgi:hypothetical protein